MGFRFVSKSRADDAALAGRLTALCRGPLFAGAVLKPRSLKLAPTATNVADLSVPDDAYLDSDLDRVVKRTGKAVAGRLMLTRVRPRGPGPVTAFLDLKFALSAEYKGGPFGSAEEVRDAALAVTAVGPSRIGVTEVEDEPHASRNAKYDRFREINDQRVPVSIERVTVLHRDVLADLVRTSGGRSG